MAFSDFSDLKATIQEWMYDRPDLAPFCDKFVSLCESDINRVLRSRRQIKVAQLTLDADSKAALPDDYLEFRNVAALTNPRRRLQAIAPGARDDAYPFRESGYPSVFSIDGSDILVLPKTTSDIEIEYFATIPALGDDMPTNWLLERVPNLYLFGCLKHSCMFIGDPERAASFGGLFNGVLEPLVREEKAAIWARGNARVAMVTP